MSNKINVVLEEVKKNEIPLTKFAEKLNINYHKLYSWLYKNRMPSAEDFKKLENWYDKRDINKESTPSVVNDDGEEYKTNIVAGKNQLIEAQKQLIETLQSQVSMLKEENERLRGR